MKRLSSCLLISTALVAFFSYTVSPSQCTDAPPRLGDVLGLRGVPVMFVDRVVSGSAAESVGLDRGDLIVAFNNQDMRQYPDHSSFLAELRIAAIRDVAVLDILKPNDEFTSYVPSEVTVSIAGTTETYLGLRLHFAYIVREVTTGGLAEQMGITPGDFIDEIDGKDVASLTAGPHGLDRILQDIASRDDPQVVLSLARWERLGSEHFRAAKRMTEGAL